MASFERLMWGSSRMEIRFWVDIWTLFRIKGQNRTVTHFYCLFFEPPAHSRHGTGVGEQTNVGTNRLCRRECLF